MKILVLLLFFAACGSEAADPGTTSTPPSVPTTPSEPEAETTPPTAPEDEGAAQALTTPNAQRDALRAARAAISDERFDDALALFDQLLRAVPRARRVWCEAGFVLHKSGNDERAARYLDHGLSLYPSDRAAPSTRIPLAMCLYNRGLVHETEGEFGLARDRYEASVELRPNATVQRRLENLHDGNTQTSRFYASANEAAFHDAIADDFRGFDDFRSQRAAQPGAVTKLGEVEMDGRQAQILAVWDDSHPLAYQFLFVAFPAEGGYRIVGFEAGMRDMTDHGVWGETQVTTVDSTRMDHGLLRAELSIEDSGGSMEELRAGDSFCYVVVEEPRLRSRYTLICDPNDHECALLRRSLEVVQEGRVEADDCGDMELPETPPSPATFALSLSVEDSNQVRFGLQSGSGQRVPVAGPVAWREWSHVCPMGM